jgi:transcriptional regulator NrdR family protein
MKCPNCNSDEVDLVSSLIDNDHCSHDYECFSCSCSFTATYEIEYIRINDEHDEDEDGP